MDLGQTGGVLGAGTDDVELVSFRFVERVGLGWAGMRCAWSGFGLGGYRVREACWGRDCVEWVGLWCVERLGVMWGWGAWCMGRGGVGMG